MKFLMLIAHGSRNPNANDEIDRLAQQVGRQVGKEFDAVLPAFLEFAEPSVLQAVRRCAELGAKEIVAVPYFLAAGNHVGRDIPRQLEAARSSHPNIVIELSPHVGGEVSMADLVVKCARNFDTDA